MPLAANLYCKPCAIKRRSNKQKKYHLKAYKKISKYAKEYWRIRRGYYIKMIKELSDLGYTVIPPKSIKESKIITIHDAT